MFSEQKLPELGNSQMMVWVLGKGVLWFHLPSDSVSRDLRVSSPWVRALSRAVKGSLQSCQSHWTWAGLTWCWSVTA